MSLRVLRSWRLKTKLIYSQNLHGVMRLLFVLVLVGAFGLLLGACDTLRTRSDVRSAKPSASHSAPHTVAPVSQGIGAGGSKGRVEEMPTQQAPAAETPTQSPPSFLSKELPKIGLILGPGGMKAFAHIGVLRELARARIPISGVVGMEWGAVIGALYAQNSLANDAEWKAMKLKDNELPIEGGFLSSRTKPRSVGVLSGFFETVFAGARIEASKISFACPAYWSRVDRFGWMNSGLAKEAMRACVPYPPLFGDNAGVLAAPFSVEESASYLRARGANVIVLVNVLAQGEILSPKMLTEQLSDGVLWGEIRRDLMRVREPHVQVLININTAGHPVTDTAGRRALIELGSKGSAEAVGKMAAHYGF